MAKPLRIDIINTSNLPLPSYHTEGAAGMDLMAAIDQEIVLKPGEWQPIPTGIHAAIPEGYELQIRGRSGLAAKFGVGPVNGVGTIDSDYRGEIHVILMNYGREPFHIQHGDRIGQAVVSRYERVEWNPVEELDETERGHGRFGSTGHKGGGSPA